MNNFFPAVDSLTVAVPEGAQQSAGGGRFKGKTIVITGASSEIGRATALQLGAEGANLVLIDYPHFKEAVASLAKEIPSPTLCFEADVTKPEDVQRYVAKTIEKFGAIHGFFNNNWNAPPSQDSWFASEENEGSFFSHKVGIDTRSIRLGLKYVSQAMKKQRKSGLVTSEEPFSIVNANNCSTTTTQHFNGASDFVANSAAGFALVGITLSAAKELAPHKIRVNAVSSAVVEGKLSSVLASSYVPSMKSYMKGGGFPLHTTSASTTKRERREGGFEAQEVAKTVAFLLSNESASLTGSNVPVCHADKMTVPSSSSNSVKRRKTMGSSI
eukprot:TRINITY_DN2393_c0_g1_i1.p1 TRINITY_DN2393_c0_g1~~TRINITY_DN2393_c0_g1_i1.p1  ORF type:complete len:328 (-),score=88.73 TRINITY_DN2393_c0_g1_i1:333-1316(-)